MNNTLFFKRQNIYKIFQRSLYRQLGDKSLNICYCLLITLIHAAFYNFVLFSLSSGLRRVVQIFSVVILSLQPVAPWSSDKFSDIKYLMVSDNNLSFFSLPDNIVSL